MYSCVSVVGGWQTETVEGLLIGPAFHKIIDLWNWQRVNLYKDSV